MKALISQNFDPPTYAQLDIIRRVAGDYDEVVYNVESSEGDRKGGEYSYSKGKIVFFGYDRLDRRERSRLLEHELRNLVKAQKVKIVSKDVLPLNLAIIHHCNAIVQMAYGLQGGNGTVPPW